jgi:hypothetical protein
MLKKTYNFIKSVFEFDQATFEANKTTYWEQRKILPNSIWILLPIKADTTLTYYQKLENTRPTIEYILNRLQFCNDYLVKSDEDLLIRLHQIKEN